MSDFIENRTNTDAKSHNGAGASLSITFVRGARRVTGSNFLVEAKNGEKIIRVLIDCGLSQGERTCESVNIEKLPYDPAAIDAIFFTHAHADHIGLFPRIVKEGFKGAAYATGPTRDLMPIMLEDSVKLITAEAERCHYQAPYTEEDVRRAVQNIREVQYHQKVQVSPDVSVTLYNAGHILGSAIAVIDAFGKRVAFTGDLGRTPAILVPDPEVPEGVEVLITESVYGNRVHGTIEDSEAALFEAVRQTDKKQGTLLIPAFSLERTQIILSALDREMTKGTIPKVKVFMDSPLAAKVTEVYRKYPEFLREDVRKRLESGDDPFSFPSLSVTSDIRDSKEIDHVQGAKIIIAGAGMSHGGRIRGHEVHYLPEKNTTILMVGYQVPGSLGRRIMDGAKEVTMDGRKVQVRANVMKTEGFSAHADRDDLTDFAEKVNPKRVFVILGETESATFLAQRIAGFLGVPVDVPREGETYQI